MLRFKQFSAVGPDLEQQVNSWLEQFEPDVTQMVQTVDGSGEVTISFLFEESFRGQELRLSSGRGVSGMSPAMPMELMHDEPVGVRAEPSQPPSDPGRG